MATFIEISIQECTEMIEGRLAHVLACFDAHKLYEKLASYAYVEGLPEGVTEALAQGNVEPLANFQEKAFVTLWNRGAFRDLQKLQLTEMAKEELQELVESHRHCDQRGEAMSRKSQERAAKRRQEARQAHATPITEITRTPEMDSIRVALNNYLERPNPIPPVTKGTTYAAGLGIRKALIEAAASVPK
jgi:hypothetical protein